MRLAVSPTRMQMLKSRKRLGLARRGHRLLQDKEEQLLLEFRKLVRSVRRRRQEIEDSLSLLYRDILFLRAGLPGSQWEDLLLLPSGPGCEILEQRVYNIPSTAIVLRPPAGLESFLFFSRPAFGDLVRRGQTLLQELLELTALENRLARFAREIERTRRRVNALEHVLIPQLQETLRFISFKLQETERGNLVRIKHVRALKFGA